MQNTLIRFGAMELIKSELKIDDLVPNLSDPFSIMDPKVIFNSGEYYVPVWVMEDGDFIKIIAKLFKIHPFPDGNTVGVHSSKAFKDIRYEGIDILNITGHADYVEKLQQQAALKAISVIDLNGYEQFISHKLESIKSYPLIERLGTYANNVCYGGFRYSVDITKYENQATNHYIIESTITLPDGEDLLEKERYILWDKSIVNFSTAMKIVIFRSQEKIKKALNYT